MSRDDVRDLLADHVLGLLPADAAARVEAALAGSSALRAEAEALRHALYAMPLALEPEPLAPGAWQALAQRVRSAGGRSADAGAADAAGGPRPLHPRGAAPRRRPGRALPRALAIALVLLAGTAAWGALQHRRAALQVHEQATVAYWMRVPGMQVVPLVAAAPAVAGVHPGVVCLLPDGRGLVLQPHPAPAGAGYVLYGDTGTGRVELGSTRGTLIEFHAGGLRSVEVAIPGPRGGVVATAALP